MELDVIKYMRWRHIYGPHRGGPTLQSPAYKFRLECVYYPGTRLKVPRDIQQYLQKCRLYVHALTSSRDHSCPHSFNSHSEIFSQIVQFQQSQDYRSQVGWQNCALFSRSHGLKSPSQNRLSCSISQFSSDSSGEFRNSLSKQDRAAFIDISSSLYTRHCFIQYFLFRATQCVATETVSERLETLFLRICDLQYLTANRETSRNQAYLCYSDQAIGWMIEKSRLLEGAKHFFSSPKRPDRISFIGVSMV